MDSKTQFNPGQIVDSDQTGAKTLFELQRELLDVYNEVGHAWLERAKAECHLWSDLATRLGEAQTAQEELDAVQRSFSERLKLVAEDGQRLMSEGRKLVGALSHTVASGWANANGKTA